MSTSNKKDNKYQIAVIPGDGIGKEVMEATISVLDELDVDFDYIYGMAGDECNEEHGTPLPQETIDIVRDSDACLFGAAGETAADVIVKIRQEMKMFANLRPVKSYPNTKSLFENVDFMIVRENTEGLYIADQEEETEDGAINVLLQEKLKNVLLITLSNMQRTTTELKLLQFTKLMFLKKLTDYLKKYSMKSAKNILILILKTFTLMQQQCIL